MRIVCVGAGPAGLYFAICAKLRTPDHEIIVFERDPPGATYGWGVTYTDELLDCMYRQDPQSARTVRAASVVWQELVAWAYHESAAYEPGYGFSISRRALLDVLARRAQELGVDLRYRSPVQDLSAELGAGLVVAADGANSRVRERYREHFGTSVELGRNHYIWLGTEQPFKHLTFALEETPAGLIWLHGYPSAEISTCVVECPAATWQGLGLDAAADSGLSVLVEVFSAVLGGASLLSQSRTGPARWARFGHVSNATWYHDNVVLVGDAGHTTHFSLGAGTTEAIKDAATLAHCLAVHPELPAALAHYDRRRRPRLDRLQREARESMALFEDLGAPRDAIGLAAVLAEGAQLRRGRRLRYRLKQIRTWRGVRRRLESGVRRSQERRRESAAARQTSR